MVCSSSRLECVQRPMLALSRHSQSPIGLSPPLGFLRGAMRKFNHKRLMALQILGLVQRLEKTRKASMPSLAFRRAFRWVLRHPLGPGSAPLDKP